MKKAETLKLLAMLSAFYGQGKADPDQMVSSWHLILKDYSYEEAENAIIAFAKTDCREYATFPAPGIIVREIEKQHAEEQGSRNRAWNTILRTEKYMALPVECREVVTEEQFIKLKKLPYELQLEQRKRFLEIASNRGKELPENL